MSITQLPLIPTHYHHNAMEDQKASKSQCSWYRHHTIWVMGATISVEHYASIFIFQKQLSHMSC